MVTVGFSRSTSSVSSTVVMEGDNEEEEEEEEEDEDENPNTKPKMFLILLTTPEVSDAGAFLMMAAGVVAVDEALSDFEVPFSIDRW